jgi:signal transduction histidine kinase
MEFSALSYFNAATNRYRYKLEGLDNQWHEVGSDQRLASYTILSWGKYTFRVQGAISRGAWSEPSAALSIEILPPWWGTWWFGVSCVGGFVLLLWALYQLRLQPLQRQFNMTLEARVGERTRIARELHDTLLQSFQGLMLRFQTVAEMLPARPLDAKKALEGALDRADQAISEGRDAIRPGEIDHRADDQLE